MEFGPEIPRWPHVATAIAKMMSMRMLRWASSCSTENGYSKLMLSAPLIGFIAVRDRYAQEQCLQASRIWQRAHLFATAHGLAARPCNEAVEMVDHERALGRPASRAALLNEITADPTWQPLLFSIWATLSCQPTPAPAVRLKLCSSGGPDPAHAPRTGSSLGNSVHRAATLPLIEGDCALVVIHFPKQGRVPFKKARAPPRDKVEAISHNPVSG